MQFHYPYKAQLKSSGGSERKRLGLPVHVQLY